MRKLGFIFFILVLALAGNSQMQKTVHEQINLNSNFAFKEKPTFKNTFLSQNSLFDIQDTNDLDGFDCVLDFQNTQNNVQYFEIKSVPAVIMRLQLIQVSELLLDLPPPLLSV